jgi:hypothetical protein
VKEFSLPGGDTNQPQRDEPSSNHRGDTDKLDGICEICASEAKSFSLIQTLVLGSIVTAVNIFHYDLTIS